MNKYKKLIYNSGLMLIGNIGSKLLVFLLLPFYTKYLTPELYGELNMITALMNFFTPILTLEIAASVFRFSNQKSNEEQNEILISSLFGIIPFMMVFLILGKFITVYFKIDYLLNYYLIISIIFLISYMNSILKENLRTNSKIKIYSLIGIIETFCTVILNVILVPKYKILGMFYSQVIALTLISLILIYFTKLYKKIFISYFNVKIIKEMLSYSLPLIPNAVIWWIIGLSDRFFLKYYFGFSEVGLYSLANKFPMVLTIIFNIFYSSFQISALEEYKSEEYNKFFNNIFEIINFILLSCTIAIIFIIKPLIEVLISDNYGEVWKFVPLLLIANLFSSYAAILGVNYLALKNSKGVLKSSAIAMITNVILNIVLIPKYSIYGASVATILSYVVLFFIRKKDSKKLINLEVDYKFYFVNIIPVLMFIILISDINEYKKYLFMGVSILVFLVFEYKKINIVLNYLKKYIKGLKVWRK